MLADEFLEYFDGFSIGSNDMTQLTLGLDRDSGLVAASFDERNPAVLKMLDMAISACRKAGQIRRHLWPGPIRPSRPGQVAARTRHQQHLAEPRYRDRAPGCTWRDREKVDTNRSARAVVSTLVYRQPISPSAQVLGYARQAGLFVCPGADLNWTGIGATIRKTTRHGPRFALRRRLEQADKECSAKAAAIFALQAPSASPTVRQSLSVIDERRGPQDLPMLCALKYEMPAVHSKL